jgi:predicted GNAT family acetyltransferase
MTSDERSIAITHLDEAGGGAFVIQREDIRLAEMTYTRAGERLIIIDHTLVDDQLRGLGVARKLLDALVAWARSSGTRVMATCPYAKAQFDKDPSIGDVYDGPR